MRLRCALAQDTGGLRADLLQVYTQTLQHAGRDALALSDQTEQEMLCANIVMVETTGFVNGKLNDLLRSGSQPYFTRCGSIAPSDDELDRRTDFVELYAEVCQYLGRKAVPFSDQPQ